MQSRTKKAFDLCKIHVKDVQMSPALSLPLSAGRWLGPDTWVPAGCGLQEAGEETRLQEAVDRCHSGGFICCSGSADRTARLALPLWVHTHKHVLRSSVGLSVWMKFYGKSLCLQYAVTSDWRGFTSAPWGSVTSVSCLSMKIPAVLSSQNLPVLLASRWDRSIMSVHWTTVWFVSLTWMRPLLSAETDLL